MRARVAENNNEYEAIGSASFGENRPSLAELMKRFLFARPECCSSFSPEMSELDTRFVHYLNSALGWLELGNPREARAELDQLPAEFADDPDVLDIRWSLHAREGDWDGALEIAERLVEVAPDDPTGWLHRAYALRRVHGGGLEKAAMILRPAFDKFSDEPTIPFNLACYACQLGQLPESRAWLKHAFKRGDKSFIKKMALSDPDLEPLWSEIPKW